MNKPEFRGMNAPAMQFTHVIEIEQEVLGSILLGGDMRRLSFLRREHFLEEYHGIIFDAVRDAYERYGIATVPVVRRMMTDGQDRAFQAVTTIDLSTYLANMAGSCVYGMARLEQSARKVVSQWARARLADEAAGLSTVACNPSADPLALISSASQCFDEIAASVRSGPNQRTRHTLDDAIDGAMEAAQAAMESGKGLTGVPWGLTDINRVTGGIQRRELTLIAARPGMGKSTFAMSVGWRAARAGDGVGFLSLEMDATKLAARAISDMAFDRNIRLPYTDLIRGSIPPEQFSAVNEMMTDFRVIPLWIDDQAGVSMTEIRTKAEILSQMAEKAGNPLKVLIIDHLGLVRASERYSGNRVHEIAEMTGGLKAMAREFDVAVIALSQLNRAVESRDNKRPQLSDLRDSGAIEQDADMIAFLYRRAYYLEREKHADHDRETERIGQLADCQNTLEFMIAKQRNGPLATIDLYVDMGCSAVRNGVKQ